MSKASKGILWFQNRFVDMRLDNAYIDTMTSLANALSHDNVDWLLSNVAGWDVVLNTPIECRQSTKGKAKGTIVREKELWNRAMKSRWQADTAVYGHIHTKAYVEHPYEKQPTKDFIVEGVLAARKLGLASSIIANQVAEIIDARLDCVLVPADPRDRVSQPHPEIKDLIGVKKDGMVQKYGLISLVDHETQAKLTLADLQKADDDMRHRVEVAMTTLTGTKWVFPSSVVAAMSNQGGPITQPKTSNPGLKLQVTNHDVQQVIDKMGLAPRQKPKDLDNGWSLYGLRGVVFSGLKANEHCALSSPDAPAVGDLKIPKEKYRRLSSMDRDEFKLLVQQHFGVVY